MKINNLPNIHFIHANGFLPEAYQTLFSHFNSRILIKNYLLINFLENNINLKLKNWIPFHDNFIETIKNKKIIGMGHSIGGNIVLRSALTNPNLFQSIILLDPTLFIPRIIFFIRYI